MTYYQRRKAKYEAQIASLKQDLRTVIYNPGSAAALDIQMRVKLEDDTEKLLWFGTPCATLETRYQGLTPFFHVELVQ